MEQETAKYRILGLMDTLDAEGNVTGQLEIGSVKELPVDVGSKCVESGTCELVTEEAAPAEELASGEADAATTATEGESSAGESSGSAVE